MGKFLQYAPQGVMTVLPKSLPIHPENPRQDTVYYNDKEQCLYIFTTEWFVFSKDELKHDKDSDYPSIEYNGVLLEVLSKKE